jgi:hypothetical protein
LGDAPERDTLEKAKTDMANTIAEIDGEEEAK